jgi:hypothetical protein
MSVQVLVPSIMRCDLDLGLLLLNEGIYVLALGTLLPEV